MNEKAAYIFVAVIAMVVVFVACSSESTSTSSYSSNKSYSSNNNYSDDDSDYYYSGKGSAWDEQVNDIYNEYGDDVGMSAEEIDAAMRAMEQGLKEQGKM